MQPVEPSTIVRGPAAFTMSFITRADSQPWQVRCPEVKYSSIVTFLTPLKGSRICVAFVNAVSAMVSVSLCMRSPRRRLRLARPALLAHAQPVGLGVGLAGLRRRVTHVGGLGDVFQSDLAAAEPADEAEQRRALVR